MTVLQSTGTNAKLQGIEKNQKNITQSKDQNTYPVNDPGELEIYSLPDKELKIIVLKELSELQEKTSRQLNEIRKMIHEQKKNTNKYWNYTKKEPYRSSGVEKYNN